MSGARSRVRAARWAVVAAAAGLLPSCAKARGPTVPQGSWDYSVRAPPAGSWQLAVEATFRGAASERLVADGQEAAFSRVTLVRGAPGAESTTEVPFDAGAWTVPSCRDACRLRYVVDLHALAASCGRLDCGRLVGDAVLSQASAWMLRPEAAGEALV